MKTTESQYDRGKVTVQITVTQQEIHPDESFLTSYFTERRISKNSEKKSRLWFCLICSYSTTPRHTEMSQKNKSTWVLPESFFCSRKSFSCKDQNYTNQRGSFPSAAH